MKCPGCDEDLICYDSRFFGENGKLRRYICQNGCGRRYKSATKEELEQVCGPTILRLSWLKGYKKVRK